MGLIYTLQQAAAPLTGKDISDLTMQIVMLVVTVISVAIAAYAALKARGSEVAAAKSADAADRSAAAAEKQNELTQRSLETDEVALAARLAIEADIGPGDQSDSGHVVIVRIVNMSLFPVAIASARMDLVDSGGEFCPLPATRLQWGEGNRFPGSIQPRRRAIAMWDGSHLRHAIPLLRNPAHIIVETECGVKAVLDSEKTRIALEKYLLIYGPSTTKAP